MSILLPAALSESAGGAPGLAALREVQIDQGGEVCSLTGLKSEPSTIGLVTRPVDQMAPSTGHVSCHAHLTGVSGDDTGVEWGSLAGVR